MDIISHYLIWLMKTSIIASGKLMSNRVGLMQISHLLCWHLCPTGLTRPHRTLNSTTFEALSSQQMAQIWSHHQNRNYHLHHEFWKHPERKSRIGSKGYIWHSPNALTAPMPCSTFNFVFLSNSHSQGCKEKLTTTKNHRYSQCEIAHYSSGFPSVLYASLVSCHVQVKPSQPAKA